MWAFVVEACCFLVACRRPALIGVSGLAWVVVLLSIMNFGMRGEATLMAGLLWLGLGCPVGYGDVVDVLLMLLFMVSMVLMIDVVGNDDGCVDDEGCVDGDDCVDEVVVWMMMLVLIIMLMLSWSV